MIKFITVWILAVQYVGSNQESHNKPQHTPFNTSPIQ